MHTEDLERVRKYRLDQAEQRGVLNAARSWFALRQDVYAETRARLIGDGIAAECRDSTIRVWSGLASDEHGAVPFATPEENLVLEVVREVVPGGAFDHVLDGYVPGEWELVFFSHISSLCLEQRLEDRRRAIADEEKDREALQRQMRRWDA